MGEIPSSFCRFSAAAALFSKNDSGTPSPSMRLFDTESIIGNLFGFVKWTKRGKPKVLRKFFGNFYEAKDAPRFSSIKKEPTHGSFFL